MKAGTHEVTKWSDWRWQLRHAAKTEADLEKHVALTEDERAALKRSRGRLPVSVTPYYLSLVDGQDPNDPIRRTVIPTTAEFRKTRGEQEDPLGEETRMVVPGLIHTYPDKVLVWVTPKCPVYCRYCTRARRVGRHFRISPQRVVQYIRDHREIRDVILSGGEPLILSDDELECWLRSLRNVSHVEIVRISTKVLAVLPQRITHELVRMLRRYHPLWMSVHFVHPRELTEEAARACARLVDAGIPLCSQTVLLKGINDDITTLRALMTGLLRLRVKPYYLHQCDAIVGRSHFRTPLERGVELLRQLHGWTSGYAVPWFMVDTAHGGKVPLSPNYVVGRRNGVCVLRNYRGRLCYYPDG